MLREGGGKLSAGGKGKTEVGGTWAYPLLKAREENAAIRNGNGGKEI